MLLRTFILGILLLTGSSVKAQSLIGMPKDEVEMHVKKEYRDFAKDNSIVKQTYNYLKYVNGSGTITFIIYFSDADIATSSKKVCDYSEYDFVLDELNEKYEQVDDVTWKYSDDFQSYVLTLEEKDWYFTVREKIDKKK